MADELKIDNDLLELIGINQILKTVSEGAINKKYIYTIQRDALQPDFGSRLIEEDNNLYLINDKKQDNVPVLVSVPPYLEDILLNKINDEPGLYYYIIKNISDTSGLINNLTSYKNYLIRNVIENANMVLHHQREENQEPPIYTETLHTKEVLDELSILKLFTLNKLCIDRVKEIEVENSVLKMLDIKKDSPDYNTVTTSAKKYDDLETKFKKTMKKDNINGYDNFSAFLRDYYLHFKNKKEKTDKDKEKLHDFYNNLTTWMKSILGEIEKGYNKYLKTNKLEYDFYKFEKINYERYSIIQLLKTRNHYKHTLKKDDDVKKNKDYVINMVEYARQRKNYMDQELGFSNLLATFNSSLTQEEVGVESEHFYDFMNYYLGLHKLDQSGKTKQRYYQEILELYMSYHSTQSNSTMKSRGLLVDHGMGTGKTQSSMGIIKGCFYNFEKTDEWSEDNVKKIFILLPAGLRYEPWISHLTDPRTRPFETIETEYDLPLHNIYLVHYNSGSEKLIGNFTKIDLNNSLIIIDEVHTITNSVAKEEGGKLYTKLYDALLKTEDLKMVCLSGTPILNYNLEYLMIMELVKGTKAFEKRIKDIFGKDTTKDAFFLDFNKKLSELAIFDPVAKNIIEKLNLLTYETQATSRDYLEPHQFQVNKDVQSFERWKTRLLQKYNKPEDATYVRNIEQLFRGLLSHYKGEELTKVEKEYIFIPMSSLQEKICNAIVKDVSNPLGDMMYQLSSINRAREINMTKGLAKQASGVAVMSDVNENFLNAITKLTEAGNIGYKGNEKDPKVLIKGDMTQLLQDVKDKPSGVFNFSNVLYHSTKLATLCLNIKENPGCHMIYCRYKKDNIYGLGSIIKMLVDMLGYEEYNTNQLIYSKNEKKKRFAIYGEGDSDTMVKEFNNKLNYKGEYIQLLLITDKAKEGVSFHSIQYEHIMHSRWEENTINQIIARGVRIGSHNELVKQGLWFNGESKIKVYFYVSVSSNKYASADMIMGLIAKDKYIKNLNFFSLINQTAIDASFNQQQIE